MFLISLNVPGQIEETIQGTNDHACPRIDIGSNMSDNINRRIA